jgi:hypothetical protein
MQRLELGDDPGRLGLDAEGDAVIDDVGHRIRLLGSSCDNAWPEFLLSCGTTMPSLAWIALSSLANPPIPADSCSRRRCAPPRPAGP